MVASFVVCDYDEAQGYQKVRGNVRAEGDQLHSPYVRSSLGESYRKHIMAETAGMMRTADEAY